MTIRLAGGLDVLVLGLGKNAHIGFNEPGSDADSIGRVLPLTPTSIDANREWFGDEHAPDMGVTTGMKTLLEAKTILLLAFGAAKSTAVEAMLDGPPTPAALRPSSRSIPIRTSLSTQPRRHVYRLARISAKLVRP